MSNSVLDVINNRTSLRVYDNREISQEILDKILHAAMRAPDRRQPDALFHPCGAG